MASPASISGNDPEWRVNDRDTQPELDELLRLAQRSNIVVYGLDSRGVYDAAAIGSESAKYDLDHNGMAMNGLIRSDESIAWENGSAMTQLAAVTGGLYLRDSNDLFSGIPQSLNDERERYVIAYAPSNDSMDGTYRKLKVEVRGKGCEFTRKLATGQPNRSLSWVAPLVSLSPLPLTPSTRLSLW